MQSETVVAVRTTPEDLAEMHIRFTTDGKGNVFVDSFGISGTTLRPLSSEQQGAFMSRIGPAVEAFHSAAKAALKDIL
jgi:hypothetical protein